MEYSWSSLHSASTLIIVLIILVLAYLWYSYAYAPYQIFKRHGIPGPTPTLLDGNTKEYSTFGPNKYEKHLIEKYGSVCGFYSGTKPFVIISDLEMLKEVFVKQFDNFVNRDAFPALLRKDRSSKVRGILQARDDTWRRARTTLTPTFSALKMKQMEPLIAESVGRLVGIIGKHAGGDNSVDVHKMFGKYTMEVILTSAFGRYKDIQNATEDDSLTVAAASIFGSAKDGSFLDAMVLRKWLSLYPWSEFLLHFLARRSTAAKGWDYLHNASMQLVKQRREQGNSNQRRDLLQLMLEAHKEDVTGREKGLSDEEIVTHGVIFLLAGYETTSNALAYCAYLLALHPNIQEKLIEKITDYLKENPNGSMYDAAQNIEYLDMVLNETLRIYPPAPRVGREASVDIQIKGYTIPKKCTVLIPIHYLHHNPENWPEPEKFNPERFSSESKKGRDPICFLPFGMGPRNCIGMRFALLEAKMALISILKEYQFVRAPDTEVPLQTAVGITMSPKNGLFVKFRKH